MELAPHESAFIVFGENGDKGNLQKTNYAPSVQTISLDQPWTVTFDHKMRGPANPVIFNTLTDWSKNANDSIKYYSGVAWYRTSFTIDNVVKGSYYKLNLGSVSAIAKVYVNGVEAGGIYGHHPTGLILPKHLNPV